MTARHNEIRDTLSIKQWYDGTFRSREIWEPELLQILWEECERRCISAVEFLQVIPDMVWLAPDGTLAREVWRAECIRLGYPEEEVEETNQ